MALIQKVCRIYTRTQQDSEDMFQEIVIQLWKSYKTFKGESKFSTWMYRVAINTAISIHRKKQREVSIEFVDTPLNNFKTDNDQKIENEKLAQLYNAISILTEIDKAIIMLYLENTSYEEMELIIGLQQNNLRVRMNRIKEKLRKHMQAMNYEY
jgi:RNA polymerase sigma-70 factor (ECF subfamily)